MTNTERLIEIAIENGWVPQYQRDRLTKYEIEAGSYKEMQAHLDLKKDYVTQGAFLDPLFPSSRLVQTRVIYICA